MYGNALPEGTLFYGLLLGVGYAVIMLSTAVIVFRRREFF
jgi:hypothetical protein